MKNIHSTCVFFTLALSFVAQAAVASIYNCGDVDIHQLVAGPRHGSLIHVSNPNCGNDGWVCLDPEAENVTQRTSDRVYDLVTTSIAENKAISLSVNTHIKPSACGGEFPSVEDVRL